MSNLSICGSRREYAALNGQGGYGRDTKLRQQDLQSMHAKDTGGLYVRSKRRTKNKIWSDVSLPVNCRCEVCVRSPNDLARKAGGVAGLADFDARCRR